MSQAIIPLAFEQYLQNKTSLGLPTDLNEIIFAYIPDLDLSQPIDRSTPLPPMGQWVHQQDVDQVGKSSANAVVYSAVIPSSANQFTFNAMFLRDKNVADGVGMIVYKNTETKEPGMTLTKSMLMAFDGAASAANVIIPVETWQIDFSARLAGMDASTQALATDINGHSWFVGDGFNVAKGDSVNSFNVAAGVGYIGGCRALLANEHILQLQTYPQFIYVDATFTGGVTGEWQTQFEIKVDSNELADYVDGDGVNHFVSKLALISGADDVIDFRQFDAINQQALVSQFLPYNPNRTYKTGEICTIEENGELIKYFCNKKSIGITPEGDLSDSWRQYPYKKISNANGYAFVRFDGYCEAVIGVTEPATGGDSVINGIVSFPVEFKRDINIYGSSGLRAYETDDPAYGNSASFVSVGLPNSNNCKYKLKIFSNVNSSVHFINFNIKGYVL